MPIRIPHLSRRNHMHGLHSAAAFTLVCALVAGLACDEKALTETREPVGPTDIGSGDEGDLVAQLDVSAMAIQLPVNQGVATTAPNPAFRINQTGTGPNGIFQISRTTSTSTALQGLHNGRGRAGLFQNTNSANPQPALRAETNGSGLAVEGIATGTRGGGGLFSITDVSNSNTALTVSTRGQGIALHARSNGMSPALEADAIGIGIRGGPAGVVQITEATNSNSAFIATTEGNGAALRAESFGLGPAGSFVNINANSTNDALNASSTNRGGSFFASQNGTGRGGTFQINNPSNSSTALTVRTNGTGPALRVVGRSIFQGTVTKPAGSFRIDHPLDPEHKYLSHSFVESPDMMNVYNGNVTLDASGRATVELPDYFEALNRDFRYQLTAIGAPGPNLYIAGGAQQNRFQIAGGRPYARVSWQVTGVRQDTYANEHRIKVEEDKPQGEKKPLQGDLVARR